MHSDIFVNIIFGHGKVCKNYRKIVKNTMGKLFNGFDVELNCIFHDFSSTKIIQSNCFAPENGIQFDQIKLDCEVFSGSLMSLLLSAYFVSVFVF